MDGDTIKVRLRTGSRRKVRLIGIDTPETRKAGVADECGGRQATRYMKRQALRRRSGRTVGEKVRLTTDPTQERIDTYGRLLAYVNRRRDGRDIGRRMIRAGWARVYVYDNVPFRRIDTYASGEHAARKENRGVWRRCGGDFHSEQ